MNTLNLEEKFTDHVDIPKTFETLFNDENNNKKRVDLFMPKNIEDHCNFLYPKFNRDKLKLNLNTTEMDFFKIHDSIISFANKKQKTITVDNIIRKIENEYNNNGYNRNQPKRRKNINLDDLIIILQNNLYSIYLLKKKNFTKFYINNTLEGSTIKELKFDTNIHNFHFNYYDLCGNIFYLIFDNLIIRYNLETSIHKSVDLNGLITSMHKSIYLNGKDKLLFEGNKYLTSIDFIVSYNSNNGNICTLKWLSDTEYSFVSHQIYFNSFITLFNNSNLLIFNSNNLLTIINLNDNQKTEYNISLPKYEIISSYSNEKYNIDNFFSNIIYFKKYDNRLFIVSNEYLIIYDLNYDITGMINSNAQKRIIKFKNKILLFKIYFDIIFILEENLNLNICNINGVINKSQQLNCKKNLLKKSLFFIKINRDKLITMNDNTIIIGVTDKLFKINIIK